jgi:hypothetical protein
LSARAWQDTTRAPFGISTLTSYFTAPAVMPWMNWRDRAM